MASLLEILKKFNGDKCNSLEDLTSSFEDIAKTVINGGYIRANGDLIRITDIEFYYFDEKSDAPLWKKDFSKYHRNSKSDKGNNIVYYFPIGSIHPHRSGVDITFENSARQYRASFLIRSYIYMQEGTFEWVNDKPTYLWDDLFGGLCILNSPISYEWIDKQLDDQLSISCKPRKNLVDYNEDGSPKKDANGNCVNDTLRKWRFEGKKIRCSRELDTYKEEQNIGDWIFDMYGSLKKGKCLTCECKRNCDISKMTNTMYVWFNEKHCNIAYLWQPTYTTHGKLRKRGFSFHEGYYSAAITKNELMSFLPPAIVSNLKPLKDISRFSDIINQAQTNFREKLRKVHSVSEIRQFFAFTDVEWNEGILSLLKDAFNGLSFTMDIKMEFVKLCNQVRDEINDVYVEEPFKPVSDEVIQSSWDNPKTKSQWVHIIYNAMRK